jgi:hypothetical protein
LEVSVESQFGALCVGFQEVDGGNFFSFFMPDELAALITGGLIDASAFARLDWSTSGLLVDLSRIACDEQTTLILS